MNEFRMQLLQNLKQKNKLQMTQDYYEASKILVSRRWVLGRQIGTMEMVLKGNNSYSIKFFAEEIVTAYKDVQEQEEKVERLWNMMGLD